MSTLKKLLRISPNHFIPDSILILVCLYGSLYIRMGWPDMWDVVGVLNRYAFLFVIVRITTFVACGVYDIIWRFISLSDTVRVLRAIGISSMLLISITYLLDLGHVPRTVFLIDSILLALSMTGIRVLRRLVYEKQVTNSETKEGRRTLVYGAGSTGRSLVSHIRSRSNSGFTVVGFIDDDRRTWGKQISGTSVLGGQENLADLIVSYRISEVFFAISKPQGVLLKKVISICNGFRIRPRITHAMTSENNTGELRELELSDLLNRPPRQLDPAPLRELIQGKKVLITGAGGSIGSELARQINALQPCQLLLLDHSELNLYQIDKDLRSATGKSNLVVPLMIDVKDVGAIRRVMKDYTPEIVFHAAAYKHVHLVEANPFSSIINNIEGTQNLLELCQEFNVETFVLISTDKAVNPAGVMGATKRVCEMMVANAGNKTRRRYCAVRFGNVLGSSGSLIPLLQQQILTGRSVTVTHADMTRYFMLIPEAVALILRAATVSNPGDIALLKMGAPLKIIDIARSLILLLGRKESDVPIEFTGLRPGEKLYEELYISGNELKTEDPDVLIVPNGDSDSDGLDVDARVQRIIHLARENDRDALYELSLLVKSKYTPPNVEGSDPQSNLLYLGQTKTQ